MITITLILLLIVGGIVAAVTLSDGDDGRTAMTVQKCSIDADGTVVASGIIRSSDSEAGNVRANVQVAFTDADTSTDLGTHSQSVEATPGGTPWEASIQVNDSVQRVTCTAFAGE